MSSLMTDESALYSKLVVVYVCTNTVLYAWRAALRGSVESVWDLGLELVRCKEDQACSRGPARRKK